MPGAHEIAHCTVAGDTPGRADARGNVLAATAAITIRRRRCVIIVLDSRPRAPSSDRLRPSRVLTRKWRRTQSARRTVWQQNAQLRRGKGAPGQRTGSSSYHVIGGLTRPAASYRPGPRTRTWKGRESYEKVPPSGAMKSWRRLCMYTRARASIHTRSACPVRLATRLSSSAQGPYALTASGANASRILHGQNE